MTKRVAIVGGGYAGYEIARALDASAEVTLIEARSAFTHPPAAIRALVQLDLMDKIVMPYDRLLERGQVVQGRAVAVDQTGVTLDGGDYIEAEYIVLATGSSYAAPFKPGADGVDGFVSAQRATHDQIKAAKSIAIVGAGAVGVELAGEIASALPGKDLTLISAHTRLFPDYPARLGQQIVKKLQNKGVRVILGQRADDLAQTSAPYAGTLTLTSGTKIASDLIIPVIGARAQSDLLTDLPGVTQGAGGRVKTDGWMRPCDHPNIFAIGDIIDVGDGMTIVAITRQAPWLAKTLKAVLGGAEVEAQKPYKPWPKAPILLPLGPRHGNSWLFATVGDAITRAMKGRDLFISKYRSHFRLKG